MSRIRIQASVPGAAQQTVELDPTNTTGRQLKDMICERVGSGFCPSAIKVIAAGRTLKDDMTIEQQGIKKDTKAVVVKVANSTTASTGSAPNSTPEAGPVGSHATQLVQERVERIVKATEKIADKTRDPSAGYDREFVEIQDSETGDVLDSLDPHDRKMLIKAIALHERGLGFLKTKDIQTAIGCFMKSEEAFHECSPSILVSFDNYAYMCLDLVWCQMLLRNVSFLQEADTRLQQMQLLPLLQVEAMFHKVHGPNLERLMRVKKGFCPEKLLYARLHLLQGVVAYHLQRRDQARRILSRVAAELKAMDASDEHLALMQSMGFGLRESRQALIAAGQNMDDAIQYLLQERTKRKEAQMKESKRHNEWTRRHKTGRTADGYAVDLAKIVSLTDMGFPRELAIAALRQSNNNMEQSMRLLLEEREALEIAAALDHERAAATHPSHPTNPSQQANPLHPTNPSQQANPLHPTNPSQQANPPQGGDECSPQPLTQAGAEAGVSGVQAPLDPDEDNEPEAVDQDEEDVFREVGQGQHSHYDDTLEQEKVILDEYTLYLSSM